MAAIPDLTRRALIAGAAALPFAASAAPAPWTREAYLEAMRRSGRPTDITEAQFNAIQARKPGAMRRIETYLTSRLGAADPAVLIDLDTPDDVRRWARAHGSRPPGFPGIGPADP